MATSLVRSGFLRTALRGGARGSQVPKRNFSSAGHHDDACKYLIISLFSNPIYFRVLIIRSAAVVLFRGSLSCIRSISVRKGFVYWWDWSSSILFEIKRIMRSVFFFFWLLIWTACGRFLSVLKSFRNFYFFSAEMDLCIHFDSKFENLFACVRNDNN